MKVILVAWSGSADVGTATKFMPEFQPASNLVREETKTRDVERKCRKYFDDISDGKTPYLFTIKKALFRDLTDGHPGVVLSSGEGSLAAWDLLTSSEFDVLNGFPNNGIVDRVDGSKICELSDVGTVLVGFGIKEFCRIVGLEALKDGKKVPLLFWRSNPFVVDLAREVRCGDTSGNVCLDVVFDFFGIKVERPYTPGADLHEDMRAITSLVVKMGLV